jgi:hypothetical protein
MTVKELMECLSKMPPDAVVWAEGAEGMYEVVHAEYEEIASWRSLKSTIFDVCRLSA